MLLNIFIGLLMIAITVSIQAYGTSYWIKYLIDKHFKFSEKKLYKKTGRIMIITALFLLFLNLSQAFVWALMYYFVPQITEFESLETAMYFSLITFTTLGYGDLTIGNSHRILSGIEAMNGILLIGWSTTLMFSVMNELWKKNTKRLSNK